MRVADLRGKALINNIQTIQSPGSFVYLFLGVFFLCCNLISVKFLPEKPVIARFTVN